MQTDKSTQCYSAVLIFESSCPAPDYDRLYEEQIVLLRATSVEEAREKQMRMESRQSTATRTDTARLLLSRSSNW